MIFDKCGTNFLNCQTSDISECNHYIGYSLETIVGWTFFPAINLLESFQSDDTFRCYDSHCISVFINFEEGKKANSYYY